MIHTQYYALMRGITKAIQERIPHVQISIWEYNYNSKVIDQLKAYDTIKPLPQATMNLTNMNKMFVYPTNLYYKPGMYFPVLDVQPNAFPVCGIKDKYDIFALTSRFNLSFDLSIKFETGAQLIDFYHVFNESFPVNFYYNDFKYDYFLWIPDSLVEGIDLENDEIINLFATMADDASNYKLFSRVEATPIFKMNSININTQKDSQEHQLNMSFDIQDSFVYNLLTVDNKRYLKAISLEIDIMVEDYNGEQTIIDTFEADTQEPGSVVESERTTDDYTNDTNNDTQIKDNT